MFVCNGGSRIVKNTSERYPFGWRLSDEGLQLREGFLDNTPPKGLGIRLGWVVVNRDHGWSNGQGNTPGMKCSFDDLLGAMATV